MKNEKAVKVGHTEATTQPSAGTRLAYTAAEAASMLGDLNVVTIHRLVRRGLLNPSRATRNFIFPAWELERFLRDNTKV